jgi:hypothetical protein
MTGSGVNAGERPAHLTERQQKWFESVRATFQRDTGKSLEEWVEIAKTCPETRPKAREKWLKDNYGLGINRAATVLSVAFPSDLNWDQPEELKAALWKDPASAAILARLEAAVAKLPDTVVGQRKAFTAFSRKVQMAAARPVRGGHAMVGFAVTPEADARLQPRGNESWGERLKAQMLITSPDQVDASVEALLKQAWERS